MLDQTKLYTMFIYYITKHSIGKITLPSMRNLKSKFKKEKDVLNYTAISAAISYLDVQHD